MSNTIIVTLMTNLINKQFYATKDDAVSKLDVYYAMNRISEEDYAALVMMAGNVYTPPEPEVPEETNISK